MLLKKIMEDIQVKKYPDLIKSNSYQIYCDTLLGLSDIKFFNYCIYKNKFLNDTNGEMLTSIYIDSKKILNIMNRFVRKIKYKLYKKYENDRDMRFIPLKNYDNSEIVEIIENKTIYSFRILDLINLWKISLYTNGNMFPRPNQLKNPFTNMVFKKYNLYNIFISFSKTNFIIPDCILAYYKCNFDMQDFRHEFFPKLQYNAIESYSKEGFVNEHHDYIISMLHDFRRTTNYAFVETRSSIFKKMKVVDLLRDFLCCYLKQKFLCNTLLKEKYERLLKRKLRYFFENNRSLSYFFFLRESEINRYERNGIEEDTDNLINSLDSNNEDDIPNTIIEEADIPETIIEEAGIPNRITNIISPTTNRSTSLPLLSNNNIIRNTYSSNSVFRRRRSLFSTALPPIIQNNYTNNLNPFRPSVELPRSPRNSSSTTANNSRVSSINRERNGNRTRRIRSGINITPDIYSRLSLGL